MTMALLLMTFVQGLAAGICFDVATVKLPTRQRIGAMAYANFARGNDLGNGLKVYPALVVGGGILVIVLTVAAYARGDTAILYPLYAAALSSVGYLAATAKAAPIMWSLRTAQDGEQGAHTETRPIRVLAFLARRISAPRIWRAAMGGRFDLSVGNNAGLNMGANRSCECRWTS
jgi:hypothetical protein